MLTSSVASEPTSPSVQSASKKYIRPRKNFSKSVISTLKGWLVAHKAHPYPTDSEKLELCKATGLSKKQLRIWFTNARKVRLPKSRESDQLSSRSRTAPHLLVTILNPRLAQAKLGSINLLQWFLLSASLNL